ncbi:MAG: hypothetical protein ACRBFS_00155 [Aureispira sp.]
MPVFDTTHNIRKIIEAIDERMGKPIPFFERFKQGGIGSRRMVLEEWSEGLTPYVNASHYLTYSNIELRPKGIMVHIHKSLDNFAWCLLYQEVQLLFFKNGQVRLEAEGEYLLFRDGYKFNKKYFDKLQNICCKQE